jgi:hypothetical protein
MWITRSKSASSVASNFDPRVVERVTPSAHCFAAGTLVKSVQADILEVLYAYKTFAAIRKRLNKPPAKFQ